MAKTILLCGLSPACVSHPRLIVPHSVICHTSLDLFLEMFSLQPLYLMHLLPGILYPWSLHGWLLLLQVSKWHFLREDILSHHLHTQSHCYITLFYFILGTCYHLKFSCPFNWFFACTLLPPYHGTINSLKAVTFSDTFKAISMPRGFPLNICWVNECTVGLL